MVTEPRNDNLRTVKCGRIRLREVLTSAVGTPDFAAPEAG